MTVRDGIHCHGEAEKGERATKKRLKERIRQRERFRLSYEVTTKNLSKKWQIQRKEHGSGLMHVLYTMIRLKKRTQRKRDARNRIPSKE